MDQKSHRKFVSLSQLMSVADGGIAGAGITQDVPMFSHVAGGFMGALMDTLIWLACIIPPQIPIGIARRRNPAAPPRGRWRQVYVAAETLPQSEVKATGSGKINCYEAIRFLRGKISSMPLIRLALISLGFVSAALAVGSIVLDFRKCHRESYQKKYGRRTCSLWMLPAAGFVFLAYFLVKSALFG